MEKILIAAALSGMLIPTLASAELNYNAVDVGYSTTSYHNDIDVAQTELGVGIAKSISGNTYFGASFGTASQPTNTGNKRINSISAGAGYHTPLKDKVDAIAEGHIVLGSAKLAGNITSANGYDIGVGLRAQFPGGLEGRLGVVHGSTSNGTFSSTNTFFHAQFGFNFLPKFQLTAGMDFKPDIKTNLGLRFYY